MVTSKYLHADVQIVVFWFRASLSIIILISRDLSELDGFLDSHFPLEARVFEVGHSLLRQSKTDADQGAFWFEHFIIFLQDVMYVVRGVVSTLNSHTSYEVTVQSRLINHDINRSFRIGEVLHVHHFV